MESAFPTRKLELKCLVFLTGHMDAFLGCLSQMQLSLALTGQGLADGIFLSGIPLCWHW
jgi:hypothetical protein